MPRWGDEAVTFDRSDTMQSALAKLEGSTMGLPVVVLASDCRIADNIVTYRLLARVGVRMGVPLAVVTSNPTWRQMARERGLMAYPSVGALRRSRGRALLSAPEKLADALITLFHPSFLRQAWPVLGLVLLLGGVVGYFLLPVMTVTLRAPAETLSQVVTVKVDVGAVSSDASSGTVPGRAIEHRFTVTDFVETTGEKQVGKERAKGEVTVLNSGAAVITIPAGAVLSTASGVKFTTVASATVSPFAQPSPVVGLTPVSGQPVPTATVTSVLPPASASGVKIPVVAVEPGEPGNAPALSISKIEGDAFPGVTVVNEKPLTGGTGEKARTISADDRAKLKEALFQRAQSQALSELTVRVGQSESLIPHSMQVTIDGEEYDKAQDEAADRLRGTVYVVATGIAFANQELNKIVEQGWKKGVPKEYKPLSLGTSISPPEVVEAGARTATLKVKVSGRAEPVVNSDQLSELVRGLSVADARSKLTNLQGGFKLVGVNLWPAWAPRAYRVEVQTIQ